MVTAYELGADAATGTGASFFNTTFFANPSKVECCSNETGSAGGNLAFGYWSPDKGVDYDPYRHLNISMKWIYGHGISGCQKVEDDRSSTISGPQNNSLLFTDVPAIAALRCTPIIETAEANVTVNGKTGEVQSFNILTKPEIDTAAWSDAFLLRDVAPGAHVDGSREVNTTTSFGILFQRSLLGAADPLGLYPYDEAQLRYENLAEQSFNYRDPQSGLNLDFMTYSMYKNHGEDDPTAFINATTFEHFAQKTFATFFQHFVSSNISLDTGGWAYQVVNATLPADLGKAQDTDAPPAPAVHVNYSLPHSRTNRTADVLVSAPVEVLEMNAVAVWLSAGILAWLIVATVVVGARQRRYLRNLDRNVDCLADVLVMVAGSERLLRLVAERGPDGLDGEMGVFTKLGWFVDGEGRRRWGVEVVDVREESGDARDPARRASE
ncbi:hypothetical protein SLS54_008891 [Diplodia seriata]